MTTRKTLTNLISLPSITACILALVLSLQFAVAQNGNSDKPQNSTGSQANGLPESGITDPDVGATSTDIQSDVQQASVRRVPTPSNGDGTGYHLFFQTPAIDGKLGSFISVDAGSYGDTRELQDHILSFKGPEGQVLHPTANEPVTVSIVVPKGAPAHYVSSFVEEVQAELAKTYSNIVFRVQVSYLDTTLADQVFDNAAAILAQEIGSAQSKGPTVERAGLQQIAADIKGDRAELRTWRDRWYGKPIQWLNDLNPKRRAGAAKVVASIKGAITFTVTLTKYGLNSTSWAIALANASITAAFGFYAVEFSQWTTSHKLPFTRNHPALEKFPPIRMYNNIPEVKSIAVNVFRSLGIAYFVRLAAYSTGQHGKGGTGAPIETPNSIKFVTEGLGLTTWEIVTDTALDVGARALAQKGYINYTARSWFIWGISVLDTIGHAYFRTGDFQRATAFFGASGVLKLTTYGFARLLPREDKQIVVISDLIARDSKDYNFIKKQLNLGEAWQPNPDQKKVSSLLDAEDITVRQVRSLFELHDVRGALVQDITNVLRTTRDPFNACMYGLSRMVPEQPNRSQLSDNIPPPLPF